MKYSFYEVFSILYSSVAHLSFTHNERTLGRRNEKMYCSDRRYIVLHFQIKATAANPGTLTSFGFVLCVLAYFPDDLYIPNI